LSLTRLNSQTYTLSLKGRLLHLEFTIALAFLMPETLMGNWFTAKLDCAVLAYLITRLLTLVRLTPAGLIAALVTVATIPKEYQFLTTRNKEGVSRANL